MLRHNTEDTETEMDENTVIDNEKAKNKSYKSIITEIADSQ